VPLPLAWVRHAPALWHVKLWDFLVRAEDVPALCSAPALRDVSITPATRDVGHRLKQGLRPDVRFVDFDAERPPDPLRRIHERRTAGGVEYSLGFDLAGMWDLETTIEAEAELRALLAASAPDLASAIAYDSDSSAVWILALDAATLQAVLAIADAEADRRTS